MFKNVMMYRMLSPWTVTAAQLEAALESGRYVECTGSQEKAVGWVEPRGKAHGALVEVQHLLIRHAVFILQLQPLFAGTDHGSGGVKARHGNVRGVGGQVAVAVYLGLICSRAGCGAVPRLSRRGYIDAIR